MMAGIPVNVNINIKMYSGPSLLGNYPSVQTSGLFRFWSTGQHQSFQQRHLSRITGRARSVLQCSAAASRAGAEVLPPPRLLIHRAFTFYNCEMRKGPQTNAELACVSATLLKMFFA